MVKIRKGNKKLTAIHETAYPRIKSNISEKELNEIYTPQDEDLEFIKRHTYASISKLGLLVFTKVFQRLGYFPAIDQIPKKVIRYIGYSSGLQRFVPEIHKYDKKGSRWKHQHLIRTFLGVKAFSGDGEKVMINSMARAAQTKDILADIINVCIEELVHQKYELPGFTILYRASVKARSDVNNIFYSQIYNELTPVGRKNIFNLLQRPKDGNRSLLFQIKQEPKQPTTNTMREFVKHMKWLRSINVNDSILDKIPEIKLKHFSDEAKTLDLAHINEMKESKRLTLIVSLIREQATKASDDFADIFIKRVQSLHNRGKDALDTHRSTHQDQTDNLVDTLEKIITAWSSEENQIKAINKIIGNKADVIMQQCKNHMVYAENNYLPFLPKLFTSQRKNFFDFIDILKIKSTTSDKSLEKSIDFIIKNKKSKAEQLSIVLNTKKDIEVLEDTDILNISWIPERWWRLVTAKSKKRSRVYEVNRKYFEICLFSCVMLELKSGDLYIDGSDKYGDYRKQLVSWEVYHDEINDYCNRIGYSDNPAMFINSLTSELQESIKKTDDSFPTNESVSIKNGQLVVGKAGKRVKPDNLDKIEKLLSERMPKTNVIDVLTDTEHWLNWTSHFKPISGYGTKIEAPQERYITTAFCYGCNLGPTQTARSMKGVDRKQIAYVNKRHIDEEKIQNAIVDTINGYNKFWLPKIWGDGKSASADGTKWDMYQRNLLSEYHIRYGGWGGIGYYHVSDNYIALFSNFISCGVWEAVYILDGLMQNKSEIRPDTLHADTQGQSSVVFALAFLLGIKLMPRIRGLKKLKFYKSDKHIKSNNIDEIFSDHINWKLIETHLPDMLRIALSISKGNITPSTILRKLGTYSRKNRLYFAFRELGRVIRTLFLLDYISDEDLRKTIRAATINSEEWNNFIDWVAFGGHGVINENIRDEQRKIIKYNHLVANLLIFNNVNTMTNILNDLTDEGHEISEEVLSFLAPYRNEHYNRFGSFDLRFDKVPEPIKDASYLPANLMN